MDGRVQQAAADGRLPGAQAYVTIEEVQQNLKRVTLRITWQEPGQTRPGSYERTVYIYRAQASGPALAPMATIGHRVQPKIRPQVAQSLSLGLAWANEQRGGRPTEKQTLARSR